MKFNYFNIFQEETNSWIKLCPPNEYRVVSPSKVKFPLPQSLIQKYDSVVIVASGQSYQGTVAHMINGHRVDVKNKVIDQMPLGLVCVGGTAVTSGCLIQHGDWEGRTSIPPTEFWDYINNSGIGNCYPIPVLPIKSAGLTSKLNIPSQKYAFNVVLEHIKGTFSGLGIS